MDNHYHAVFQTPNGNLVEGMKWLQNTYTRRLNSRHQLWGHLFGGRYRSILIENEGLGSAIWRDYLRTGIDYVHLNPGRARLVDGLEVSCREYQWSSIATAYAVAPSKRPKWMAVREGLDLFQLKDSVKGRREYVERIDTWITDEQGVPSVAGVSVEDRVKRGWFWGSEFFKESILETIGSTIGEYHREGGKNRNYRASWMVKDHAAKSAKAILFAAIDHFGLDGESELKRKVKGDLTRVAVATRLFHETTMSQHWIADKLSMKSAANVGQQIRKFRQINPRSLPPKVRKWLKIKIC